MFSIKKSKACCSIWKPNGCFFFFLPPCPTLKGFCKAEFEKILLRGEVCWQNIHHEIEQGECGCKLFLRLTNDRRKKFIKSIQAAEVFGFGCMFVCLRECERERAAWGLGIYSFYFLAFLCTASTSTYYEDNCLPNLGVF